MAQGNAAMAVGSVKVLPPAPVLVGRAGVTKLDCRVPDVFSYHGVFGEAGMKAQGDRDGLVLCPSVL